MSSSLRHFMLISMVGMTFVLASLLFFHIQLSEDYLDDHLGTHNRHLTILLRNSLISQGLMQSLESSVQGFSEEEIREIDEVLNRTLLWVPVAKVKIFDRNSRVLYSTNKDEIGRSALNNPGVASALSGQPASDLVEREDLNTFDNHPIGESDLHQQYVPIKHAGSGEVIGVFELYTDVSPLLEEIHARQDHVFWSIAGILTLFYLTLALSFERTHRLLIAERRRREEHLAELLEIRAELEDRVADRTAELARSQRFLQSVIDGIGSAVLVIRPDLTIALMNKAARRLLPDDSAPESYRHCYQVSHRLDVPCSGDDHPCSFEQVMKHQRPTRVRHTHYDANNQPIIVDLLTTPLYGDDGNLEGVIEVEHDVTQLVRIQAGLIESEARLQSIMDNVPDGIFTCDSSGIVQSVNSAATRLLATSESSVLGRPLPSILYGEDTQRRHNPLSVTQRELSLARGDGSSLPIELWVGPLRVGDSEGCVAVIRDISARRSAQEELERTRQQYFHQEKMAAIGQLAAGILHEVGNPIAAIAGAANELKHVQACGNSPSGDCPYDDVVGRNISLIDSQTTRLAKITREIADFASPRPRERELLDLNSLLRSTARLLAYDRRFRDVDLQLRLDKTLPAVEGVADQLTQVFMNLLINALDACSALTGPAEKKAHIVVASCWDGTHVEASVSDNGCGIAEDALLRIMEPFYTTKPVGKGTGLGLSLCDTIVRAHGGRIRIDSMEGTGTTVAVVLPVEAPAAGG